MSSRYAALTALLFVMACDSPAAPRARDLRIPGLSRDAGTVLIKGNVVFDTDASFQNTCNGDFVTLQGKAHQVFTEIETGTETADTIHVKVHTNFADLKGYGIPSGARYHANNTQMERDVVAMGSEFTMDGKLQWSTELISEGSEPNLILDVTEVFRIDDGGVTTTDVKYSLKCTG